MPYYYMNKAGTPAAPAFAGEAGAGESRKNINYKLVRILI